MEKKRILTGDRPTGKLHLGHYIGSHKNRVELQEKYDCFFLIADLHMFTTKIQKEEVAEIPQNISDLILDYLAIGIDPEKATIYLQSQVPEVTYLSTLLSMLVTVPRLQRIPTLKEVMHDLQIEKPSFGLLGYPVLMAADILMVRANLVPVGKDQEAHVELARELTRKFNADYGEVFPEPEVLVGSNETLVGLDGKTKMSKSLGNCIYLSDSPEAVKEKVMSIYTDPKRIHIDTPGTVEGNPVFIYHDAFNENKTEVEDLKARYRKGAVGDVEVKERLAAAINKFLDPIRARRKEFEKQQEIVNNIIKKGNERARKEAQETLRLVKQAMGLEYF